MWLMCQFNAGFARNNEFGPTKGINPVKTKPEKPWFKHYQLPKSFLNEIYKLEMLTSVHYASNQSRPIISVLISYP
jgi:hypothetical protein